MENNKEQIYKMVEEVLSESAKIGENFDRVSRAYINCIAEIKEARIDFTKQISMISDRVSKIEKILKTE